MGNTYITLEEINALDPNDITPLISYAVGLCFFQLKVCEIDQQKYVVGGINHNPQNVTKKEIFEHYNALRLFQEQDDKYFFKILANQKKVVNIESKEEQQLSAKSGFTMLIPYTNTNSDEIDYIYKLILSISTKLLKLNNLSPYFLGGLFDGRSSYDKTAHFITTDYSDKYKSKDFDNIVDKLIVLGVNDKLININVRKPGIKKANQFRIKKEELQKNVSNCDVVLFSTKRKSQICG